MTITARKSKAERTLELEVREEKVKRLQSADQIRDDADKIRSYRNGIVHDSSEPYEIAEIDQVLSFLSRYVSKLPKNPRKIKKPSIRSWADVRYFVVALSAISFCSTWCMHYPARDARC